MSDLTRSILRWGASMLIMVLIALPLMFGTLLLLHAEGPLIGGLIGITWGLVVIIAAGILFAEWDGRAS